MSKSKRKEQSKGDEDFENSILSRLTREYQQPPPQVAQPEAGEGEQGEQPAQQQQQREDIYAYALGGQFWRTCTLRWVVVAPDHSPRRLSPYRPKLANLGSTSVEVPQWLSSDGWWFGAFWRQLGGGGGWELSHRAARAFSRLGTPPTKCLG